MKTAKTIITIASVITAFAFFIRWSNAHDLEVMEEYKEEPGSGEGRDEVNNEIYELDANTPDVGDAVTAECHSELKLNV